MLSNFKWYKNRIIYGKVCIQVDFISYCPLLTYRISWKHQTHYSWNTEEPLQILCLPLPNAVYGVALPEPHSLAGASPSYRFNSQPLVVRIAASQFLAAALAWLRIFSFLFSSRLFTACYAVVLLFMYFFSICLSMKKITLNSFICLYNELAREKSFNSIKCFVALAVWSCVGNLAGFTICYNVFDVCDGPILHKQHPTKGKHTIFTCTT